MTDSIDRELRRLKKNSALPKHIAVIMDGNGRWARKRRLPRLTGHKEGREAVRTTVRTCAKLGISVLSLYTFSLENWRRPKAEVTGLMLFLKNVLKSEYLELKEKNIRLRAIGRLDMLPQDTHDVLVETIENLSGNTGMILNLCLSYGGRDEIVHAVEGLVGGLERGEIERDGITEEVFARYLFAPDLPDPDLLIRTSGELRVSNFLLWQIAYTEIVVMDVLWPDFREEHIFAAIREFLKRDRRYGDISKTPRGKN